MPLIASRIDVERIRVRAERAACETLEREEPASRLQYVPRDSTTHRREVMAQALLLTDSMAPDACAAGRDAMTALGVDDRLELFRSQGHGDTVRLVLYGSPIGVEFLGRYLEMHDRPAITAAIGHEIGHALAHCTDPTFGWALSASQSANTPTRRTYSLAAEITADRFGLLACRDLDAVLRLEMLSVVGPSDGMRLDTQAYLTQCRTFADELLSNGGSIRDGTHPEHYLRSYAEWLFTETDLYAELTGIGSGSRSIADVDALIDRLLIRRERPQQESPRPASEVLGKGFSAMGELAMGMAELTHASVAETVARATRNVGSKLEALIGSSTSRAEEAPSEEPELDLLDQEERDLEARFAELERREREKR